jgi:hypothetical protein
MSDSPLQRYAEFAHNLDALTERLWDGAHEAEAGSEEGLKRWLVEQLARAAVGQRELELRVRALETARGED